jgi:hypothetical protein
MTELGPVAWPPVPIRTERVVLRAPEGRDRAAVIELFASPEVNAYVAALDRVMISTVKCRKYPAGHPAVSWSTSTER